MKPLIKYINENADNKELSALYKYIKQNQGQKDFAFEKPVRKKQILAFHFSGPDEVDDIMKHGFKRGTSLEHLRNTESGFHSDENGIYCFAWDLKTFINDWHGCAAYGDYMCVLMVDCVTCKHKFDEDQQCIFIKGTEKPIASFEVEQTKYSWGWEPTFKRRDKKMNICTSIRELLFESDFAEELSKYGIDLMNDKYASKLLRY